MNDIATFSVAGAGYQSGVGNGFKTEALPGALPIGRNSPQRCTYGLYVEQISGSPYTAQRASNQRSWLYRIRPTVAHWGTFHPSDAGLWRTAPCAEIQIPPAPMRWDPIPMPDTKLTFLQGMRTITTAGDAASLAGMAAHVYLAALAQAGRHLGVHVRNAVSAERDRLRRRARPAAAWLRHLRRCTGEAV
jgi:homogentisate 1,2-dioxygenase